MYRIIKRIEVSGAHHLTLPYESKCSRLHGHNWIIEVTLENETLNESGMLVDLVKLSVLFISWIMLTLMRLCQGLIRRQKILPSGYVIKFLTA